MNQNIILASPIHMPSVEIAPTVTMPMLNFGVTTMHPLFLSLGGRGLDTAYDYGDAAQKEVGSAMAGSGLPRSAMFLTTKVPCCPSAFVSHSTYSSHCHSRRSAKETSSDIAHDLKMLNVSYVDLMLMHWPCDSLADNIQTWQVLETLLFNGRARAIGVSNFNASTLDALVANPRVKVKPAVNQIAFSIAGHTDVPYKNQTWGRSDATVARCKQLGVTPVAYSPLGHWSMGGTSRVLGNPTVKAIAAAHNRTAAAIALHWVTQQGLPVVTSSDKEAHIVDDLENVFNFRLSAREMAQLAEIQ